MHVAFMLILNERVTSGFGDVRIVDDENLFDRTIALKLAAQLRFGCVVVLEIGKRKYKLTIQYFHLR